MAKLSISYADINFLNQAEALSMQLNLPLVDLKACTQKKSWNGPKKFRNHFFESDFLQCFCIKPQN